MTEQEKQQLRALKFDTVSYLHDLRDRKDLYGHYFGVLADTDQRMEDYVRTVIDHPDDHNLYELLKIKRFFRLADRYAWNKKLVQSKIKFYEKLKFSGTSGRRSYKLTPVQVFQMAHIFGFMRDERRRLVRTTYLFVPRKFSKTTFAAFLAVDDMFFGDVNAEAYIGANSLDQAKKCFNEVRNIMFYLDENQTHFRINRESVRFLDHERESSVQCLTANDNTKDGLFASLVVMDEYAQARNTATKNGADLKNVLTTSMGPRLNPLTVIITTASDVLDGPCYQEIEGAKAVLRGEMENDSLFADLFMPDVDDEDGDPRTWAKVQPHIGVTVQPDFYEQEWANAQMSASNMLAFRTKLLNRFVVNEEQTWVSHEKAAQLLRDFDIDRIPGRPLCVAAFDLSVRDDFSAVSYTVYDRQTRGFLTHTDYYFPRGSLSSHPNRTLYEAWIAGGHLKLCDGDVIDVNLIAEDIMRRARNLNIVRIGYDKYKAQELTNILIAYGGRDQLMPYTQTYGSFNQPVERFEMMAYRHPPQISMNNNPINSYCLANCILDADNLGNKKPIKASPTRKIDGAITMLMTIGLADMLQY